MHDTLLRCCCRQVLSLARNYLSDLPSELFRALSHLRMVDVSHNRLRSLPDNLWSEGSTERVDLSNNQLSRFPITSFSAAAANTLVELDVSSNYLIALFPPEQLGRFRVSVRRGGFRDLKGGKFSGKKR